MERAFFDVRVSHPGAPTNSAYETPAEMYAAHEKQKMTKYNHRVIQIEKGTFAPLCFSTTGGMEGEEYGDVVRVLRTKLRLALLKTTLIAVRGHREKACDKDLKV